MTIAAAAGGRRVHVMQGEARVDGGDAVLTTLLGSCVAACIRDAQAGVGGMNHFLLPGDDTNGASASGRAESYGLYLMELLINGLLKRGARRHALEAKLFGGANTVDNLGDIGGRNIAFARRFLADEGIACLGGDLGGERGRRIEYWPASGRSRRIFIDGRTPMAAARPMIPIAGGDLELF